jgi:large subunit ribosomal protein L25
MANKTELVVSPRDATAKATKRLRSQGIIPANIFGRGLESEKIQVASLAFEKLRREHQATSLVTLKIEGSSKTETALIRHVQRHPTSRSILHIDFLRVSLKDKITAKVPLHFEGVAPGVKIEGGVLLHLVEALEVECEAGDIVDFVAVDISNMEKIDDMLLAKDIQLPSGYILIADAEEPVVKIIAPRAERAGEAAEAPAAPEAKGESAGA